MSKFHNRTRTSESIPARLASEGKWYLLPVYYVLWMSDLAREGIRNSGSYQFADHIYAGRPSGRFLFGTLLDAVLLRLNSARSMRARYLHARKEIADLIASSPGDRELRILSVPSGLARELFESAAAFPVASNSEHGRLHWTGMDLDLELIDALNRKAARRGARMRFLAGDALTDGDHWGGSRYDMIISTGFTEFLDDELAERFQRLVLAHLSQGGVFVTSGMRRDPFSDYLLRNIGELRVHYRSEPELRILAGRVGFGQVRTYSDGLQTMVIAGK
jgi:hypothetical protein